MKINIIGPSASGKSWLANELSKKTDTKIYSTDKLLYKHNRYNQKRSFDAKAFEQEIARIISQKNWILEGKYFSKRVFKKSNYIILTERGLVDRLFRQWWRFITDTEQRKKYGLISNLKLSGNIIRQQFGLYHSKKLKYNKKVYSKSKILLMTRGFKEKFIVVKKKVDFKSLSIGI